MISVLCPNLSLCSSASMTWKKKVTAGCTPQNGTTNRLMPIAPRVEIFHPHFLSPYHRRCKAAPILNTPGPSANKTFYQPDLHFWIRRSVFVFRICLMLLKELIIDNHLVLSFAPRQNISRCDMNRFLCTLKYSTTLFRNLMIFH